MARLTLDHFMICHQTEDKAVKAHIFHCLPIIAEELVNSTSLI